MSPAAVIRPATAADVDAILAIKRALPLRVAAGSSRGGFLLGADAARYHLLITGGPCLILELDGAPIGFTTALRDPALRASELWHRQQEIAWVDGFSPAALADESIAYFDQIAVLPGIRRRYWGAALGLRTLAALFTDHHHVLTTTVAAPVVNRAALAFIRRVGGHVVGSLDESYPEIGTITSTIHHITAEAFAAGLAEHHRRHPALAPILELGAGEPTQRPDPAAMARAAGCIDRGDRA